MTDSCRAFGSLSEKVADYEAMLRDLSIRVGLEDAHSIKVLLAKVCQQPNILSKNSLKSDSVHWLGYDEW